MSFFSKYNDTLKPLEVEEWVDLIFYRPLGFLFAYPLSFTPVTPNMVTLFSGIVGIAGGIAILFGTKELIAAGAWLYLFSNVLDCTDGQLARLKRQYSPYGRIYDGVADFAVGLGIFLSIAISWRPEGYNVIFWWVLVLGCGMGSTIYQGMHLNHVREAYLNAIGFSHRANEEDHKTEKKKAKRKRKLFLLPFDLLYWFYMWVEGGVRVRVRMPKHLHNRSQRTAMLETALIVWTFTGKGTHVTLLALFLFLGRPDHYMWLALIPWNLWIFAAWIGHIQGLRSMAGKPPLSQEII